VPFPFRLQSHWGMLIKGPFSCAKTSCMNLSPDMVREFVMPHDQRLLNEFGGGAVHFCGHGDHFVELLTAMDGVSAVNISQPELNNMENHLSRHVDRGINLIGCLRQRWAALATDRPCVAGAPDGVRGMSVGSTSPR